MTDKRENPDPKRPYLVRAIREWCMDNGLTPQILVDAAAEGVVVPPEGVKEGVIVLNVHERAVRDLDLNNESAGFLARFGGVTRSVFIPMDAILAVYARENGEGLFFGAPDDETREPEAVASGGGADRERTPRRGKPDLKLV